MRDPARWGALGPGYRRVSKGYSIHSSRQEHRAFEHMRLVLRAAGAQSLGLRMIFIWEASSRKRIHVVMLFTSGPVLSIPLFCLSSYNSGLPTASQHGRGDGYCAATFYYVTEANYMTYYVCYITMAYNIN